MTREEAIQYIDGLHCEEDFPYTDTIAYFVKERNEAIDMAIEALSAEEAVWNEHEAEFTDLPDIPRYYYEKVVGNMAHEINMLKEQLESADAEWILCSERLPMEKDDRVLVTKCGEVMIAIHSEFNDTWYLGEMCAVGGEDPIAWMPLPTPYKGGDEE